MPDPAPVADATVRYVAHQFDLLGSGQVTVRHGMVAAGFAGWLYPAQEAIEADDDGRWLAGRISAGNQAEARRVWRLVDPGYFPIDWHLDFKSGWRWSERTWYRDIAYGTMPGADVKVPWELSRMQHLPQLAVAFGLAAAGERGFDPADSCLREFRNEVLDFIATNPPRYGVNWCMTMDVAIRVANWLVAYDLFTGAGAEFDDGFERVFRKSILQHARHIATNLEWSAESHTNHFLADVVGLLFASAYLPSNGETDGWLAFAIHELIGEVDSQFHPEGTNVEASTAYHRLSSEMAAYAAALVLGLPDERLRALSRADPSIVRGGPRVEPGTLKMYATADGHLTPLPSSFFERLALMASFMVDVTKPNGRAWQIGDNDSGRFLRLLPAAPDGRGHDLDFSETVAAIDGLIGRPGQGEAPLLSGFTRALSRGRLPPAADPSARTATATVGSDADVDALVAWLDALPRGRRIRVEIPVPLGAFTGSSRLAYPDFGAFILRSERAFLGVRCGPVGQNGVGGHAHNDQLAIELNVDGHDLIADPGSYVYTALPERRNAYRSIAAHFGPGLEGGEPRGLGLGLFRLGPGPEARCLYWGARGFAGEAPAAGGGRLLSFVTVERERIIVTYGSDGRILWATDDRRLDWRELQGRVPFSSGYGRVDR